MLRGWEATGQRIRWADRAESVVDIAAMRPRKFVFNVFGFFPNLLRGARRGSI